jgi:hypothetical protein
MPARLPQICRPVVSSTPIFSGLLLNQHLGDVSDGLWSRHQGDLHLQAG